MIDDEGEFYKGPWKYKEMKLEDHFSLTVFKISRLLNKITGLQVTSPDLDGRESEIPIDFDLVDAINEASNPLTVIHWVLLKTHYCEQITLML